MNEVQSLGFISSKLKFIYFKNFIEIWLTDNVILVSSIQCNDTTNL